MNSNFFELLPWHAGAEAELLSRCGKAGDKTKIKPRQVADIEKRSPQIGIHRSGFSHEESIEGQK